MPRLIKLHSFPSPNRCSKRSERRIGAACSWFDNARGMALATWQMGFGAASDRLALIVPMRGSLIMTIIVDDEERRG